jgi:hypothetical protein
MSLIIRNPNCIRASGLQTLVETARGAIWVPTQTAPRAVSTSVCKPEALIQLRFPMMSDITLETCLNYWRKWNNKNSVTGLHLVVDLLLVILRCTVPWILNSFDVLTSYISFRRGPNTEKVTSCVTSESTNRSTVAKDSCPGVAT